MASKQINLNLIQDPIIRNNFAVLDERSDLLPIGSIVEFANNNLPEKYLLCDNKEYSREIYSALFALIGTKHGSGDGINTFNVPNKTMTTTLYGVKYK